MVPLFDITFPSFFEIVQVAMVQVSIAVHVFAFGRSLCRLAQFEAVNRWLGLATICGAGFSAFGFELWLLGYLNAWSLTGYLSSTAISAALLLFTLLNRRKSESTQKDDLEARSVKLDVLDRRVTLYLTGLSLLVISIGALACFKPPINGDEVAYHWPAPLLWAGMHHWSPSPFRFANGPSFVQLFFLPSALIQSISAGHFTHFLMWGVLVTAACGLGSLLAAPTSAVVAAFCACPVITTLAVQMQNDVGVTAFLFATVGTLASLRGKEDSRRLKGLLLAALIFCGALSTKQPFAVALMPIILLFIWTELRAPTLKVQLRQQAAFLLPAVATILLWCAHTYYLTGGFVDVPMKSVWTNSTQPTDPAHPYSGVLGLAGPPSPQKVVVLLIAPFVTWLIGNQEPFGGRTGVVIPVFMLMFLCFARKFEGEQKRLAAWLLAFSLFYYVGMGIFVIRVRYHLFVWSLWTLLSAVAFGCSYNQFGGRKRLIIAFLFCLLATISCVDNCRTLLIWNAIAPQLLPQVPWLLK